MTEDAVRLIMDVTRTAMAGRYIVGRLQDYSLNSKAFAMLRNTLGLPIVVHNGYILLAFPKKLKAWTRDGRRVVVVARTDNSWVGRNGTWWGLRELHFDKDE